MRKSIRLLSVFIAFILLLGTSDKIAYAQTPLPVSTWYAVIWNRTDDTLHWVNNATELASISRPKLPGETTGADLYISPNGRWMMLTAMLENQQQGIGFYDFQTGEWLQTHTATPNESFIAAERNPFSHDSAYAAIGLHSNVGWRVIGFETATGNAIGQLMSSHPDIPPNFVPAQAVPRVTLYSVDEGLAQWRIHTRFITQGPNPEPTSQPSLVWYPETDTVTPDTFDTLLLDLDILPIQNRVVYSLRDANNPAQTRIYGQTLGNEGQVVYEQTGAFINQPRWVASGLFVAFRLTQGAQVPMWYLGGYGSDNYIPFAPDYDELLGTSDGFVLVDYEGGEVKFANVLVFEAYAPTVGNVIYTTDTSNFHVAYITPMGLSFTLPGLATPPELVGGEAVQAPVQNCGTAPAARLTVGNAARVSFTDGMSLNVRTAAAGDLLMQIPEGTVVNVIDGPVCVDNYLWWNLQFESDNVTVGGWAAEGDSEQYFLEPFIIGQLDVAIQSTPTTVLLIDPPLQATPTVALQVAPPLQQATPTVALQVAPPLQATPTIALQVAPPTNMGDGNCSNAPAEAQLTTGAFANTNIDGTLAMRTNLNDSTPSHNIPNRQTVMVQNGPVCNGGFRMWYVSLTLNGTPISGWVADGFGNNRYLRPGMARAN